MVITYKNGNISRYDDEVRTAYAAANDALGSARTK